MPFRLAENGVRWTRASYTQYCSPVCTHPRRTETQTNSDTQMDPTRVEDTALEWLRAPDRLRGRPLPQMGDQLAEPRLVELRVQVPRKRLAEVLLRHARAARAREEHHRPPRRRGIRLVGEDTLLVHDAATAAAARRVGR
eukprot:705233-Prymnesium_polylepis.1